MDSLRVALLQMTAVGNDQTANLVKGTEFCRRARHQGADIALFPEMWNIGYTSINTEEVARWQADLWLSPERWPATTPVFDPTEAVATTEWQNQGVERDGPFVTHFQQLAAELNMAIGLTYLERWSGGPRNSFSLIDRHGQIVFTYAKLHTCDFSPTEAACTPGQDFEVGDLDTAVGPVRVGAMICYDREFPEAARILMLKGAEIILTPNACELEINRLSQFRARAYENMVGLAMTNYAAPQQNGHSIAFDGIAFDRQGCSRDMVIVEADSNEGLFLAEFDLAALRDYRQRESWGNAFRRPHRYALLTSTELQPPFVRVNSTGQPYDTTRR